MDPHGLVLPLARISTLGGYAIGEILGSGGMGVVYRGVDREGQPCAVKVLAPEVTANPDFLQRFKRELTLGPKLSHPHIVDIWDVGDQSGYIYLVMPLIEGRNLKEIIAESPISLKEAVRLLRPIAEALDHAHEVGVVHCDLKPQNILVQEDPRVAFISDFGLVRPAGVESTASRSREVFGSVQYMAPEQIEGLPVDGRTDVYGLACTIFEALTGRIPFERPNEVAVLWAHVNDELPRVTDVDRRLPGGLDEAVAKGMAKHPDDRYLTCGELISAIEEATVSARRSLLLPPVRPLIERKKRLSTEREVWSPNFFPELARVRNASRTHEWKGVATFALATVLTVAVAAQVVHPQGINGAAADVTSLVRDGGERLREFATGEPRSTEEVSDAPSGATAGRGTVRVRAPRKSAADGVVTRSEKGGAGPAEASTGILFPQREEVQDPSPSVLPRSGIVFTRIVEGAAEIFLLDDGNHLRNLTKNPAGDYSPTLSPDGRRVGFGSNRFDNQSDLYVMDLDGSGVTKVTSDRALDLDPAWSPDGKWLAYTSYEDPRCTANCAISNDPGDGDIRIARLDGSEIRTLATTEDNKHPEWSPSGRSIVFVRNSDLYTMEIDGSGFTRLTDTPGNEYAPSWSPDGKKIAYGFLGSIRVLNLETNKVRELTTLPEGSDSPTWSPDGSAIAYSRCRDAPADCGAHRLWIIDVATGRQSALFPTSTSDYFPDWGVIAR